MFFISLIFPFKSFTIYKSSDDVDVSKMSSKLMHFSNIHWLYFMSVLPKFNFTKHSRLAQNNLMRNPIQLYHSFSNIHLTCVFVESNYCSNAVVYLNYLMYLMDYLNNFYIILVNTLFLYLVEGCCVLYWAKHLFIDNKILVK